MDIKSSLFYKSLVIGVILLFIGVAVQPSIATVQPKEETIDIEPKDYLFQTIIDIANNPDVKELLEQTKSNGLFFDCDYNLKGVYRKILFRNPRQFFNILFTKPSMTYDYLDKCYNKGIEITNVLGEDKVLEIIENVEVTDTEILDELNNIISNNEELSGRLTLLKEMNKELNSYDSFWDNYPIICSILAVILISVLVRFFIFIPLSNIIYMIFNIFGGSIINDILQPIIYERGLWLIYVIYIIGKIMLSNLECIILILS